MLDKKVAVIGLDGMAWRYLDILFNYGAMPYLRSFARESSRGTLVSTFPPFTAAAWTSITSGVNPGKHGVFDFISMRTRTDKELEMHVNDSKDVMYPRIHEMLTMHDLKSVVVNLAFTYPIQRVDNVMIIPGLRPNRMVCYPSLMKKYAENYPKYEVVKEVFEVKDEKERAMIVLDKLYKDCSQRTKTLIKMLRTLDWNLFWVVLWEPDRLLHYAHDFILGGHPKAMKIFSQMDLVVKEALKTADLVMIVSDHGFTEYKYLISVNTLLYKSGLAKVTHARNRQLDYLIRKGGLSSKKNPINIPIPRPLIRIAFMGSLGKLVRTLYSSVARVKFLSLAKPQVDIEHSKAVMLTKTGMGVYLIDKNVGKQVLDALNSVPGVAWAKRREEVYWGKWVKRAPDILVCPDFEGGYDIEAPFIPEIKPRPTFKWRSVSHHPLGIAILGGKEVVSKSFTCNATDITPTILRYLGLPLPNDTDGKPITAIRSPKTSSENFNYLKQWKMEVKRPERGYTPREEEEIKEHLRSLGYM